MSVCVLYTFVFSLCDCVSVCEAVERVGENRSGPGMVVVGLSRWY